MSSAFFPVVCSRDLQACYCVSFSLGRFLYDFAVGFVIAKGLLLLLFFFALP